mmetsp:Transcript_99069/g.170606  ORF Transcript_99069/g.170606 Transcript_99069/m.170606 type:complete len:120 (-) Transcript_99069:862-1221(-)
MMPPMGFLNFLHHLHRCIHPFDLVAWLNVAPTVQCIPNPTVQYCASATQYLVPAPDCLPTNGAMPHTPLSPSIRQQSTCPPPSPWTKRAILLNVPCFLSRPPCHIKPTTSHGSIGASIT